MSTPQVPIPSIERYIKVSTDDLSGFWLDAYGWIACYFAQLEGLSYALVEMLGSPQDRAKMAKLPYQDRVEKARELVCEHLKARGEVELADEWTVFLEEARATAPMRNKILHNPLSVSLALGEQLHDEDAGIVLTHEPGQPVLKLAAVQQFSKTMLEMNIRMQSLLARSALAAT
ncbi:hypothetical protein ASE11_01955 [Hydrogenophaga sp. Root209]|uniref:hypothetical protein n=1 Tax=Hydrogenophaga sp. Root209 TaxID=1736490 RepID=UPI0006F45949|nr:hypothetical protein [Hydrogenophaga sp. Root209]KRC12249.1 hypothetical protein ASE11_01955 [Hydrogenophaga sp. Root209]